MSQSWTLCWTFTARSSRKAPQPSLSPPCRCSSSTTTSTSTPTTRPPSSDPLLPRGGILLEAEEKTAEEKTVEDYAVLSAPTPEACVSSWLLPMTTAPRTQPLHPTPRPQPLSPRPPCCLLIAHTQPWSPPMVPPKEHTSLTCLLHLHPQGASPSVCPPCCIPPTSDAPPTPSRMK